eukprot:scpid27928/ scgid28830/ 
MARNWEQEEKASYNIGGSGNGNCCTLQLLDSSCVAFAPSFRCHLQSSYRHSFVRLEEVRPSSSSFIIRLSRLLAVVVTGGPGHDVKLCPENLKKKRKKKDGR